jgi:acetyl/propionyl-CoA carboxylase alpha subunit
MRRALREYEVEGIRTTVPFFRWLLGQPDFEAAAFHTGYLEALLQQRQGAPFAVPGDDDEQAAAIAAALHFLSYPDGSGASTPDGRVEAEVSSLAAWKQQARAEALRG